MFASEAKAILAGSGGTPSLDPTALRAYLALGYVPAPLSIFAGIRKLPPATLLIAERGPRPGAALLDAAPGGGLGPYRGAVDRGRARAARAFGGDADGERRADRRFFVGGVDSSAVVGFMARHTGHPVRTYAIGFEGGDAEAYYNELPFARQVAQRFGTEHHEIVVKPDVVGLLPKLLWHMDEPMPTPHS